MNPNPETGAAVSAAMNKPQAGDPPWLIEALKLDGLKESPGASHNPEVVKLFAEAGHSGVKDDETAWCAAFVGAMLARAGYLGSGKLTARSYLDIGDKVTNPIRGDIVVFPRGNSEWQGHVAFVLKADAQYVFAFGGNQSNAVNLTRYSRANVLGFRRPVATTIVRDVQAKLRDLGFNGADNVDGVMGPKTKKAIAAYEVHKGFAPFPTVQALHRHLKPAQPDPAPAPPKPAPDPTPAELKRGKLGWWLLGIVFIAALIIAAFTIQF